MHDRTAALEQFRAGGLTAYPGNQCCARFVRVVLQGTFPDDRNAPICFAQILDCLEITLAVPRQFRFPEIRPCRRHPKQRAIVVVVPKASVDKHDSTPPPQNDIWPAGKTAALEPESET